MNLIRVLLFGVRCRIFTYCTPTFGSIEQNFIFLVFIFTLSLLAFQISLNFIHLKIIHYKMLSEYFDERFTSNVTLFRSQRIHLFLLHLKT